MQAYLVNALLFQALWFAAVLGAANSMAWIALIPFALLCWWQLSAVRRHPGDIKLLLSALMMGVVFDSLFINAGWLQYASPLPFAQLSPFWIVLMWGGLALTINHSLAFMKKSIVVAFALGAISGPLSYLAGARLGALQWSGNTAVIVAALAIGWGLACAALVLLARNATHSEENISCPTP